MQGGKAIYEKAIVFDIQKFSVHDGPGIRTTVFFKGCPLHCQWCANPESQKHTQELLFFPDKCTGCGKCVGICQKNCITDQDGIIKFNRKNCIGCLACTKACSSKARKQCGTEMTLEQIIIEVNKDTVFYNISGGGVTFSGGEAMCFPEIVTEIAKYYKAKDISTAIETCGHVSWKNFKEVLPYIDILLFDLKLMDSELHKKYVGSSNNQVLENLKKACKMVHTIVRIPIIPEINDGKDAIRAMGEFLATIKEHIALVNLLPYHDFGMGKYEALGRTYLCKDIKAPTDDQMEDIKKQLEVYDLRVKIGG